MSSRRFVGRHFLLACGLTLMWLPMQGMARARWQSRLRLRDRHLEHAVEAPGATIDRLYDLGGARRNDSRPEGLGRSRQSCRAQSGYRRWSPRTCSRCVCTTLKPASGASMHGQRQRRYAERPTVGEFKDGRGEFYDQEVFEGRVILVRNVWTNITADSCRFEQSFSDDGGKTWELNWIAVDTREGLSSCEADSMLAPTYRDEPCWRWLQWRQRWSRASRAPRSLRQHGPSCHPISPK